MKKIAVFLVLVLLVGIAPGGVTVFGTTYVPNFTVTFGPSITARTSPAAVDVSSVPVTTGSSWAQGTVIEFTTSMNQPGFLPLWTVNNGQRPERTHTITLTITNHTHVSVTLAPSAGHGGNGVNFSHHNVWNQTVAFNQSHTIQMSIQLTDAGRNSGFTHLHWEWLRHGVPWDNWNYQHMGWGAWNRVGSIHANQMTHNNWHPISLTLPGNLNHSQRGGSWSVRVTLRDANNNTIGNFVDHSHSVTVSVTGATGGYYVGGIWHPYGSGGGGARGVFPATGGPGTTVIRGRQTPAQAAAEGDAPPADLDAQPDAGVVLPIWTGVHPTLATAGVHAIRLTIGQSSFTHWGIPQISDAAPFIDPDYDRTMVPLRIIAEAMDASVRWEGWSRSVFITRGGVEVRLQIDEPLPDGMGTPVLVNDRTFVPLRYVSEVLGASVRWNDATRAVYVYR